MIRTRTRKIIRDIVARRGRSTLVILSILIGVFGVTTMISMMDLLTSQLEQDIRPEAIANAHVYVRPVSAVGDNQAYLEALRRLEGAEDVEGQAVHPVAWAHHAATTYEDGFLVAFSEGFEGADLEPVSRLTAGRFPTAGEIAVEQRFADAHDIALGDTLTFRRDGQPMPVVGFVLHSYFTIAPSLGDQIQPDTAIYATFEDSQRITDGAGLTAFHIRGDVDLDAVMATISSQTPYVTTFTFIDDPDDNFILEVVGNFSTALSALGVVAMIVSGFLVTNVMNSIVVEQKRQIGTMKSLGATAWDNLYIYAGIALAYGVVGTVIGLALAVPVAGMMVQSIAPQSFTYIDEIRVSWLGLGLGATLGLAVPVLAALVPVLGATRISILESMTDLGISSDWGQSRVTRTIGRLPFHTMVVRAISQLYQKRGRLVLTGLTLTMAVAAFMGVTAVDDTLRTFVTDLENVYDYEIGVTLQTSRSLEEIDSLLRAEVDAIEAVYPGYNATVGVEGFESTDPLTEGSDQVEAVGINPATPVVNFDLHAGTGWAEDPTRPGVVISRSIADNMNVTVGDTLTLTVGGQTYARPIIGIDNYAFAALFIEWRDLATMAGYVDEAGQPLESVFYLDVQGSPSPDATDDVIDAVEEALATRDLSASFINRPALNEAQSQQIGMFGVIFNFTSVVMALVGGIGLMATLSMAVFERQKEIGVMRSIGATSLTIISQFMLEGVLVGVLAWIVATPLSAGLGSGIIEALGFDYLHFDYPPLVLVLGLGGVIIVTALASIWPSLAASRKTVADILRYS